METDTPVRNPVARAIGEQLARQAARVRSRTIFAPANEHAITPVRVPRDIGYSDQRTQNGGLAIEDPENVCANALRRGD